MYRREDGGRGIGFFKAMRRCWCRSCWSRLSGGWRVGMAKKRLLLEKIGVDGQIRNCMSFLAEKYEVEHQKHVPWLSIRSYQCCSSTEPTALCDLQVRSPAYVPGGRVCSQFRQRLSQIGINSISSMYRDHRNSGCVKIKKRYERRQRGILRDCLMTNYRERLRAYNRSFHVALHTIERVRHHASQV